MPDTELEPPARRPIADERLAEIRDLKFTTGVGPSVGVFATDVERELYQLAARCWNALQDLLRDHDHLTAASAATAQRLAEWEGAVA